MPRSAHDFRPDLDTLARLFYADPDDLGQFEEVTIGELPSAYRMLLAHTNHMTVTVEEYHQSSVDVHVLDKRVTPTHYARKILLTRQNDGRVVQFGIMRVNLSYLEPDVRDEIQREATPLGRILIEHNVLRRVNLFGVWRVVPGPDLQKLLGLSGPQVTYGRTAIIDCNDEPAIELIEIVTPVE
jgi:chorismate-pyruvate lyase